MIGTDSLKNLAIKNQKLKEKYKISVVIPNYNYGRFLKERVRSILMQTVKIYEIIFLDDGSNDDSQEIINEIMYEIEPCIRVKKEFNKENSGCVFKQWQKGFSLADGDYIWMAEADDSCDENLLKKLIKPLRDANVVLSYCDSMIIDGDGKMIKPSVKDEIDIRKTGHWDKPFINDGGLELHNYMFLNLTIFNVSSALIKKGNYDKIFSICTDFKQAGDWLFYINLMSYGKIAYSPEIHNFYRWHGQNTTALTPKVRRLNEVKIIYFYITKIIKLTDEQINLIENRYKYLLEHYFNY